MNDRGTPPPGLPLFAMFAAAALLLGDVLASVGWQAFATVGVAAVGLVLLPYAWTSAGRESKSVSSQGRRIGGAELALWAFVFYSGALLLIGPNKEGLQNWLVWLLLPMTARLVASASAPNSPERFLKWWRRTAVVSASVYLTNVALFGFGWSAGIYSARSAGWTAATSLSLLVAFAAVAGASVWPAVLVAAASIASLSRTATVISAGLLALLFAAKQRRYLGRAPMALLAVLACIASYTALWRFPAFRDRFTQGDAAFQFEGIRLNTSGRMELWTTTLRGASETPLFGHGPGAVQHFVLHHFGTIEHPHNEYLRLFYDTGTIGLLLWLTGLSGLMLNCWKQYNTAVVAIDRAVHLAALIGLAVFLLGSLTDNLTVYLERRSPVGAALGMSLGRIDREAAPEEYDLTEEAQEHA